MKLKSKGRDGVILFQQRFIGESRDDILAIEQKLYQTLNGNNLKVYYQPQFDSNDENDSRL